MTFIKNPLNFIKKANKSFNIYLKNYKKINQFLDNYMKYQEKFNQFFGEYEKDQEKFNQFFGEYEKDQEKFNQFLNYFYTKNKEVEKAVDLVNKMYHDKKEYFFNGEENLFNIEDSDHFFQMCLLNNIKLLSYSPSENRICLKNEDGIIISTNNYYYVVKELFALNGYSVPQLQFFKEFVVFDIGMNRGYSALKFANYDTCKAVYGFEIEEETYNFALENFDLNPKITDKIKPYNFGLSDKEGTIDLYYLPGADGITTTELEFTNNNLTWIKEKEKMITKKAKVKEAGSVLLDIIKNENITSNIVLKIDTEGAEHNIIDDLIKKGVLDKIDIIMGEIHLESEDLEDKLIGFKKISKFNYTDTIYSFCFVKEELYNVLPKFN